MENNLYTDEYEELTKLKMIVMESLKNAPEGRMRCEMAQGKYPQYYVIRADEIEHYPKGRYLRKSEIEIAREYAQKEYDKMILAEILKREREIRNITSVKNLANLRTVFQKLPVAKQCLITPYILSDEEYIQKWLETRLEVENSYPIINGYITEKGELVRSKSEKMIADKLLSRKIPYKYEAALLNNGGKVFFPDFTLLNVRTRKEVYLEHFGMMDNPTYCQNALRKLEEYEEDGVYLGDNLIVTFESSMKGINMRQMDAYIDRFLI